MSSLDLTPKKFVIISILKIVLIVFSIVVVFLVLIPVQFSYPNLATRMACAVSNLKQVSIATLIYVADFDDLFPPDTSSVASAKPYLRTYVKNSEVFASTKPASPSFLGNGSLARQNATQIKEPDKLMLFFDSTPWESKVRLTSFVDSHVRSIKEEDYQIAVVNKWRVK